MQYIEYKSLEKIAEITRGVSWKSGEESSEKSFENVRAYKIPHIIKNKKYVSEDEPLYIKKYKKHEAKLLTYNDILMITSNGNPNRVGNISLYKSREIAVPASFLLKIRGKEVVEQEFLYYFLSSDKAQSNITGSVAGSTGLRNINMAALKGLKVPVPPLKEQQKIAEILSTADEQIEQTDQLIEKTKELKKGLMQQLLTKGIAHTEYKESECGIIPDNWVVNSIEYICDYRKDKINPLKSERQKYIALENIEQGSGRINGYLHSDDSTSMKSVFKKGDTLFNKLRPYLNKYWYATFDGVCATELLPLTSKNNTDSLFLYYCLQQERVLGYVTQRTFGTKMPRTSWKELKEILIPIPPVNEQKQIAEILFLVDEEIEGYEKERAKYEELKKGLMQQLLTGKTRVKVD